MSLIPDGDGERKVDQAINRMFAGAMARTDAAILQGQGLLRIRSAGLAAGMPEKTITKSQENFLAMNKRHKAPAPARISPETAEKIRAGSANGGFRAIPWDKPAPTDDVITEEPTVLLPLPISPASLQSYADTLKTIAEMMGLPEGRAEVLESSNPGHILLRWVTK